MSVDLLADTFSIIKNAEDLGKENCITPASKLIKNVLSVIQKAGYIGDFEHEGKFKLKISLNKRINKCGVIKPQYFIKNDEFEKWEKRYLPAAGLGILILTTSKGVMDHASAKKEKIGGRLLAYVY